MLKIKRYVIELAADRKRDMRDAYRFAAEHDNEEAKQYASEEMDRIDSILQQCKYGYIHEYEAVRLLMK